MAVLHRAERASGASNSSAEMLPSRPGPGAWFNNGEGPEGHELQREVWTIGGALSSLQAINCGVQLHPGPGVRSSKGFWSELALQRLARRLSKGPLLQEACSTSLERLGMFTEVMINSFEWPYDALRIASALLHREPEFAQTAVIKSAP